MFMPLLKMQFLPYVEQAETEEVLEFCRKIKELLTYIEEGEYEEQKI